MHSKSAQSDQYISPPQLCISITVTHFKPNPICLTSCFFTQSCGFTAAKEADAYFLKDTLQHLSIACKKSAMFSEYHHKALK